MLIRLQSFARRFAGFRKPLLIGILLMPVVILWLLIRSDGASGDTALIPAILFFAWLLLLHTALTMFTRVPAMEPEQSWWQRQVTRFVRFVYAILALLVTGLAIATVVTTLQLASAWLRTYGL